MLIPFSIFAVGILAKKGTLFVHTGFHYGFKWKEHRFFARTNVRKLRVAYNEVFRESTDGTNQFLGRPDWEALIGKSFLKDGEASSSMDYVMSICH